LSIPGGEAKAGKRCVCCVCVCVCGWVVLWLQEPLPPY
jgi:hypothetical protein